MSLAGSPRRRSANLLALLSIVAAFPDVFVAGSAASGETVGSESISRRSSTAAGVAEGSSDSGPAVFLKYEFNGDFTHSTIAQLVDAEAKDITDIKPEPRSFTCCTDKGIAFWSGNDAVSEDVASAGYGDQEGGLHIGYLDLKSTKVQYSSWGISNPGPPQFGPLHFYDTRGSDDLFLAFRSPNFPHGTWELQLLNATDGSTSTYYKFDSIFQGNNLVTSAKFGDTIAVMFTTTVGVSVVTVDVSFAGPTGTIVYNGTQNLDQMVLAPVPDSDTAFTPWTAYFCETTPSALCFAYVSPLTSGLVPFGPPLPMPKTYIRTMTYDANNGTLLVTYGEEGYGAGAGQMLVSVPLAAGGREKNVIGPLGDAQCKASSENGCWIGEVFVAPVY